MAIIAVDFDSVIHDPTRKGPGMRMGLPLEGAIEAMKGIKANGHTIVIFTVRGDKPKHVMDWLHYYHIPFDDVTNVKKNFDLIIDDKAVHFDGWSNLKGLWS